VHAVNNQGRKFVFAVEEKRRTTSNYNLNRSLFMAYLYEFSFTKNKP